MGLEAAAPCARQAERDGRPRLIEPFDDGFGFVLVPAWRRDCGVSPGDAVEVVLAPEGPQRQDLADDVRVALEADPEAAAFFDGLAQFYRKAYLRWIDGTKRRPDERQRRIAEMVELLRRGQKERPQQPRPPG